jgi:aminoglycoside phosphotransferase family enzyme
MSAHDPRSSVAPERLATDDHVDPALLRFLLDPRSFGEGVDDVSVVESHMSLVFLAGDRAYKLKKPIAFDALDFRTLEKRHLNCQRELTLNRVLSEDIYLGLEAVTRDREDRLHLGGPGEIVEWLVVMRRLDEARLLDHAIAAGTVTREDIESLTAILGPFYAKPLDEPPSSKEVIAGWTDMLERNAQSLRRPDFGLPSGQVEDVLSALARFLAENRELILARIDAGWIRECHGDLRPQHVYLGPPLRLIDRLEYDERLRRQDPFEEIMDLGVECERMGAAWILPMLIDGVSTYLGDRPDPRLVGFYGGMRATLRARFAIEHLEGTRGTPEQWRARAMASLDLARKYSSAQS